MRLILKHTFKNILAHKLRTLLLVVCIAVCSFTALICFDMKDSLSAMIKGLFVAQAGQTDIMVTTKSPMDEDFGKGAPDCTIMKIGGCSCYFDRKLDIDISYVSREQLNVMAVDPDAAKKLKLVRSDVEVGGRKVAVSELFAKEFGFKKGDKIILHGERDIPVEFTISGIEKKQGIFYSGNVALIDLEDMKDMVITDEPELEMAYIDVNDDSQIKEAENFFKKAYPTAEVENFMDNEALQEQLRSITRLFVVLFALCMLLVIFVTISVCERMIVDKMSVVGTFRSLGISTKMTTFALLFENAMFGLVGSAVGAYLYCISKQPLFDSMFTFSADGEEFIHPDVPTPKAFVVIAVIIGSVLVECLCPIKEVIKAVKTPIRDIIFDTKDTEYRPSRMGTIIGFVLLAVSAVTFFMKESFAMNMTCFVSFIAAVALLFNYIYRFIAKAFEKLFAKLNFPIAHLAAVEAGAKKCTVGSAVLCVTAASLALVIYIFANSLAALYNHEIYKSDVIAYLSGSEKKYLSYVEQLDGVDEVEFIYYNFDEIKIDSKKTDAIVYGFNEGGYRQFNAFDGIPENVSEGEVVMDKFLMAKKGYKVGDDIKITFLSEDYLPIEKTLKIAGKVDVDYNAASGIAVIISEKDYKAIYKDHPECMLAKGKDAKSLKETIEDHSADYVSEIYTLPEFLKEQQVQSASLKAIIILLIIIGVGMTFIGVVSNQLIGLEGRKRECAVMASVAMPRKKLSKMFLIESFIASVVSLAAAVPIGIVMSHVFMRIMEILENYIPLTISVSRCVSCAMILCAVFTFVSLFPIRALKKMDLVSQLKYE